MSRGFVVALLGAESTGKTALARRLGETFAARGNAVAVVGEALREFCDREQRTPRRDEQAAIATEQTRRIATAAASHDVVVADTTALMTAVYSDWVFADESLYAGAESAQRAYGATLVTALDLAWEADGLQRDGPQVREPVDALVRAALARADCAYAVVSGHGTARLDAAIAAIDRAAGETAAPTPGPRWQWHCERCGDAACERHLLARR